MNEDIEDEAFLARTQRRVDATRTMDELRTITHVEFVTVGKRSAEMGMGPRAFLEMLHEILDGLAVVDARDSGDADDYRMIAVMARAAIEGYLKESA